MSTLDSKTADHARGARPFENDTLQGGWAAVSIDPVTNRRHGAVMPVLALQPEYDARPMGC